MPEAPQGDSRATISPSDEIVKAYYSNVVNAAQVARGRAQVGFTIASAVTIGLGAGGILSGIAERSVGVRVLGAVALGCWFAAAFAFLRAVSSPTKQPQRGRFSGDDIADALLDNVEYERDCVQKRQLVAQSLVAAALVTTFATVCALVLFAPDDRTDTRHAHVALRWPRDLPRTLPAGCAARTGVAGTVDVMDLEEEVIEVRGVPCANGGTLELPRRTIRAIVLDRPR
jgi:hypothetical protein